MATDVPKQPSPTDRAMLARLVAGNRVTHIIAVAARLRLTDHLATGAKTPGEVAGLVGAEPAIMGRFLRTLAALDLLESAGDGRFTLTPMGSLLSPGVPGSAYDMVTVQSREYVQQPWAALEHSLRTGDSAFEHVHGVSNWTYRNEHPEDGRDFNRLMTAMSEQALPAIFEVYDFRPFRRIVDVGGGRGHLLAAALEVNGTASGVLFDQPSVIEDARPYLDQRRILNRCELIGGSFFDEVPEGGDLYMLKAILHDWPDRTACDILTACRRAMGASARLLVIERVVRDGPDVRRDVALDDALADMNMLVMQAGQERTEDEFHALFARTGFALRRVIPAASPLSLIEAEPVT